MDLLVPGDVIALNDQVGSEKRYFAPAAACAAEVLRLLGATGVPLSVPELARHLRQSKSLVYRVTRELEKATLLERRGDHRYWLGVGVVELGGAFVARTDYLGSARAALHELAEVTGETANIAVLRDADVFYVMKHEGHNANVTISHVGARLPASCTALGKMLLAGMPDEAVRERCNGPVQKLTPNSIDTLDKLLRELGQVRLQGYATEVGETIIGRCCIAVEVRVGGLGERAAMSVAASAEDFNERRGPLLDALTVARTRAEREITGRGAMDQVGAIASDGASYR